MITLDSKLATPVPTHNVSTTDSNRLIDRVEIEIDHQSPLTTPISAYHTSVESKSYEVLDEWIIQRHQLFHNLILPQ